ncbi:C-type lectin domain family 17, member A-like [Palaemon carinicauda]|uniref:C-type lectin domain family 17, member A-like n=1 Tax=Palaemon carinicauda TaxID=392227 RepID=UPI0035B62E7B
MGNLKLFVLFGFILQLGSSYQLTSDAGRIGPCPHPYEDVGGHCLHFTDVVKGNWSEMREYCHEVGGEMLKLDDANLIYDIQRYVEDDRVTASYFYVGGSDLDHEGDWRWTDGSPVKMRSPFWGFNCGADGFTREPTNKEGEDCLYISKSSFFFMHDCFCTNKYSVICEY